MEPEAVIQLIAFLTKHPGFDPVQIARDVFALKALAEAASGMPKFNLEALQKTGLVEPGIDAAARLIPIVARLRADPVMYAKALALAKTFI